MRQNGRTNLYLKMLGKCTLVGLLLVMLASVGIVARASAFTPGEGGHITDVAPFASTPNTIAGLYVRTNHRYPNSMGGGAYPQLNMNFPIPSTYDATSVTLQYSVDELNWLNFQTDGVDVTSVNDNFSIRPDGNYQYRLLVSGGPKNGFTSNVVIADLSLINTRFSSWGLDEGMWISNVMIPWVGRGLTASFSVINIDDNSPIEGYLDYQWYRVNPATYEMTTIDGATDLTYITTLDDVGGYRLICRATGDGSEVGGYAQVGSLEYGTVIPNPAEVSNLTRHGFTLNLKKSVDSLMLETLTLTYQDSETFANIAIEITSVTKLADAVYQVNAEIPLTVFSLYLQNTSDTWRIATEIGEEPWLMMHEGLNITFPTPSRATPWIPLLLLN